MPTLRILLCLIFCFSLAACIGDEPSSPPPVEGEDPVVQEPSSPPPVEGEDPVVQEPSSPPSGGGGSPSPVVTPRPNPTPTRPAEPEQLAPLYERWTQSFMSTWAHDSEFDFLKVNRFINCGAPFQHDPIRLGGKTDYAGYGVIRLYTELPDIEDLSPASCRYYPESGTLLGAEGIAYGEAAGSEPEDLEGYQNYWSGEAVVFSSSDAHGATITNFARGVADMYIHPDLEDPERHMIVSIGLDWMFSEGGSVSTRVTGGSGSGATVSRIRVTGDGNIREIIWSNHGTNYVTGDTITITQGSATAVYTVKASDVFGTMLQDFGVFSSDAHSVARGTGYTVTTLTGSGSGASTTRITVNGEGHITYIGWTSGGTGYATGDQIRFTQGDTEVIYTIQDGDHTAGVLQHFYTRNIAPTKGKNIDSVGENFLWGYHPARNTKETARNITMSGDSFSHDNLSNSAGTYYLSGRFFGPGNIEAAGVFRIDGDIQGAFGVKRQEISKN